MKFALTALTSAAMAGVMVSAQDPSHDLIALQAEYNALAPKLIALIPEGAAIPGKFDLDLNSLGGLMAIKKTPFPYSGVGPTTSRPSGTTDTLSWLTGWSSRPGPASKPAGSDFRL